MNSDKSIELLSKSPELIVVKYDSETNNILLSFKDSFKELSLKTKADLVDKVIESLMSITSGIPLVSVYDSEEDIVVKSHSLYSILSLSSQANILMHVSKSVKKLAEQLQEQAELTTERLQ